LREYYHNNKLITKGEVGMKIGFVGAGYVGLVSATGYALAGNECVCIDIDPIKVKQINSGIPPIFENGLEEALKKLTIEKRLQASNDFNQLKNCAILFICVGTPSLKSGEIDLSQVASSSEKIGAILKESADFKIVIVKSTVVPGTTLGLVKNKLEIKSGKKGGKEFGIAMMPEFLREGSALEDFKNPDRIVIGCEDDKSLEILKTLHKNINCPILITNATTAEMVKYASNSFLATKISFINQLANLAERANLDIDVIAQGMGLDKRIGKQFLKAGPGFGGSCFPKDVLALINYSKTMGIRQTILETVMEVNEKQVYRMIELAKEDIDLNKSFVAVLGLSFKPDTDDIRYSPAINLVTKLQDLECTINVYDPKGMDNFRKIFPKINYTKSVEEAILGTSACFVVTDWKEFIKSPSFFEKSMKNPLIIDSRRILSDKGKRTAKYKFIGKPKDNK
jgi:UDPglucose 6-dehydrogenase